MLLGGDCRAGQREDGDGYFPGRGGRSPVQEDCERGEEEQYAERFRAAGDIGYRFGLDGMQQEDGSGEAGEQRIVRSARIRQRQQLAHDKEQQNTVQYVEDNIQYMKAKRVPWITGN